MNKKKSQSKYGAPVDLSKVIRRRKRRPEYTKCLQEFLESGDKAWKVELGVLPSKKPRVVLSSLKWRIRKFPEFKGVKAFMTNGEIYLERVDKDEQ
jgi:hypothetical protein